MQLVYHLLVRNTEVADPDMRFYLLDAARMLCLHADVLSSAARLDITRVSPITGHDRSCTSKTVTGHKNLTATR